MAEIEYIWNMGPYEHALWRGTKAEWDQEAEESLLDIGRQWYAAKGYVVYGRDNPAPTSRPAPIETTTQGLIETELGGKVIEVTEHQEQPAWAVSVTPKAKDWEQPAWAAPDATDDGDDW